jgi:hypothetical protein
MNQLDLDSGFALPKRGSAEPFLGMGFWGQVRGFSGRLRAVGEKVV